MLGAIIGDIVGSRFEFHPTSNYNFELFDKKCSFTDDTICTIAVADAIIKGMDYGESLHYWCRKNLSPMVSYGGRFKKWVMSNNPQPYFSYGNGSAMRVSPIAWWFNSISEIGQEAAKSAECTHNHPLGIGGAQAVAAAIHHCRQMRKQKNGESITRADIDRLFRQHIGDTWYFDIDIEDYRNRFDETCQGTVPVALVIIVNSTSFEDAIRQAVSLGADADTLGAIVGSIAEALWGIPEWMKKKALTYLPKEMQHVVKEFHRQLNCRRKLSAMCKYYLVDGFGSVDEKHQPAYDVERNWVDLLSKDDSQRDAIKSFMREVMPLHRWQDVADEFALPLTLVGKICQEQCGKRGISKAAMKRFDKFMDEHYDHVRGERREALEHKKYVKTMMLWKLGLGNMGRFFNGENPMPSKDKIATRNMCEINPIEEDDKSVEEGYLIPIDYSDLEILRNGHIPDAQEDHWFMYFDDETYTIRYIRSWTGNEAFVAYLKDFSHGCMITKVEMNKNLCEFGVNGNNAGIALLRYLIVAETGGEAMAAWNEYLNEWEALNKKSGRMQKK